MIVFNIYQIIIDSSVLFYLNITLILTSIKEIDWKLVIESYNYLSDPIGYFFRA